MGFTHPFVGESITDLQILETDIRRILEVTRLRLVVTAVLATAVERRTGIVGIGVRLHDTALHEERVLVTPKIEVLGQGSRPCIVGVGTPEIGRTLPVVALHHALEEDTQIHTVPCGIEVDTELVTRGTVAQHLEVAVVLHRAFACGDTPIAVEVGIHNITCAPARTEGGLPLTGFGGEITVVVEVVLVQLVEVGIHLLLRLRDTHRLVPPDITDFLTGYVLVDRARGIARVAGNHRLCVGEQKLRAIGKAVAETVLPSDFELPTIGFEVGIVGFGRGVTEDRRQFDRSAHHIDGVTGIVVERTREAVVKERPVETDVPVAHLFPRQFGSDSGRDSDGSGFLSVLEPCASIDGRRESQIGRIPTVGVLVAEFAVRTTYLEGADGMLVGFHKRLFGNVPTERNRRIKIPAQFAAVAGRTIVAEVCLQKVTTEIVVVETPEETGSTPRVAATIRREFFLLPLLCTRVPHQPRSQVYLRMVRRDKSVSRNAILLLPKVLCLRTEHKAEIVRVVHAEVVGSAEVSDNVIFTITLLRDGGGGDVLADRLPIDVAVVGRERVGFGVLRTETIVEIADDEPVLERFKSERELLIEVVGYLVVLPTLQEIATGPYIGIKVAVVVIEREIRPVLASEVLIETIVHSRRLGIVLADKTCAIADLEPVGKVGIQFACTAETLQVLLAEIEQTLLFHIVERDIVVYFLVAAVGGEVMFLREIVIFEEYVVPVVVGIGSVERVLPLCSALGERQNGGYLALLVVQDTLDGLIGKLDGVHIVGGIACRLVVVLGKGVGVHLVHLDDRRTPTEVVVVVDLRLACLTVLGGNQNHTERRTRTIDRRSRSIFQHGDILYILRVDGVEVALHTVNQDKRATA